MTQPQPRLCVHCGEPELPRPPVTLTVDPGKEDKTAYGLVMANPERPLRLAAVLPGDEKPCMTTWRDRVIIGQGNHIYELKYESEHDVYDLIELSVPPGQEPQSLGEKP